MSDYRRPRVTGATILFTVRAARPGSDLLVRHIDLLCRAVRTTRAERPFGIAAWVVLPDHLHCIWRLPVGDRDFSTRWGAIKARFTIALGRAGFSPPMELPVVSSGRYAGLKPGLRQHKRERGVWQRRFWEHHIRDEQDLSAHVHYCWFNPVKHGLVAHPAEWPHSSFHADIRAGRVPREWCGPAPGMAAGE